MYNQGPSQDLEPALINAPSFRGKSFNKRLDSTQLDIHEEDRSCLATVVRYITGIVSRTLSPRQVIVVLRLLKATTFCTLCLSIIADLMFVYIELQLSDDVGIKLGGTRDRILRVYGIGIALLAVLVELDMKMISSHLGGLKPFLIRSLMLLYVATVSGSSPMIGYERRQYRKDKYGNNDDDNDNDYDNNGYSYNNGYNQYNIRDEVPGSAVAFQSITSFILLCCACAYFLLGVLCLDRFTARAFLADDDQVAAAVSATALRDPSARSNSFDSYIENNAHGGHNNYTTNNGTYSPNRPYS